MPLDSLGPAPTSLYKDPRYASGSLRPDLLPVPAPGFISAVPSFWLSRSSSGLWLHPSRLRTRSRFRPGRLWPSTALTSHLSPGFVLTPNSGLRLLPGFPQMALAPSRLSSSSVPAPDCGLRLSAPSWLPPDPVPTPSWASQPPQLSALACPGSRSSPNFGSRSSPNSILAPDSGLRLSAPSWPPPDPVTTPSWASQPSPTPSWLSTNGPGFGSQLRPPTLCSSLSRLRATPPARSQAQRPRPPYP